MKVPIICTAISYNITDHYFGRNLDVGQSYGERVVITPRQFTIPMRCMNPLITTHAIIGMAVEKDGFPLYFDATNEQGLSMAGLNFPDHTVYNQINPQTDNVTPFELIVWILAQCSDVKDAIHLLERINIVNIPFSESLPLTPLHWILADKNNCIAIESTKNGLQIHENQYGVLTNSPPFDYQLLHLARYMQIHEGSAENKISKGQQLPNHSLGMGAIGLPGDYSSESRFVKAVYVKEKSISNGSETENVHQFFHILSSVEMPKGCVLMPDGNCEYTHYSSCCNTDKGIYYYTTYNNRKISEVNMHHAELDVKDLIIYDLSC